MSPDRPLAIISVAADLDGRHPQTLLTSAHQGIVRPTRNAGGTVPVDDLVPRAQGEHADDVLVTQVVTQKDAHLTNTMEMSTAFRVAYGAQRPLLVVGGPRFDPLRTKELGVDRVFTKGTTPSEVASYLAHALLGTGRAA